MKVHRTAGHTAFVPLVFMVGVSGIGLGESPTRPSMTAPSPAEEAMKSLTSTVETACHNRDVIGFLACFTPKRAAQIRRPIEDLFICQDVDIEVQNTLLVAVTESELVFGIRYTCGDGVSPPELIASRVTARKVNEVWLLDDEEILSRRSPKRQSQEGTQPVVRAPGGQVPLAGRPDWIPADIEWVPGGCANGRCGL